MNRNFTTFFYTLIGTIFQIRTLRIFFEKEIKQFMSESTFQSFKTETKGMYYYIEGLLYKMHIV